MGSFIDMTGAVCGNLTVISFEGIAEKGGEAQWKCRCSCGKEKSVKGRNLRDGNTKSCGCHGETRNQVCEQCGIKKHLSKFTFSRPTRTYRPICQECFRGDELQKCTQCGNEKLIAEFMFCRKTYKYKEICRDCNARQLTREAPSRRASQLREKQKNDSRRAKALAYYGGKCACCGEDTTVFLAIDHLSNNGNKHRYEAGRRRIGRIGGWLETNGYPDGFQVLCNNCNWAKHANELCPHQIDKAVAGLSFGS